MKITKNSPPSTRDKIIEKAENLFSKYNYNSVSLNDIAKEMKITKAALYYHFENKEELFSEVLKKSHTEISKKLTELMKNKIPLEEQFRKIIMAVLDAKISRRSLTNLTVQKLSKNDKHISKLVCDFKDQGLKIIEPLMKKIIKKCNYPENTDPQALAFFILTAVRGYSIQKACGSHKEWTSKQFADEIINIIFRK